MKQLVSITTGILLSVVTFLVVFQIYALSPLFYTNNFEKTSDLQLSHEDYQKTGQAIVDMLNEGNTDLDFTVTIAGGSIVLLNEKEQIHLHDLYVLAGQFKGLLLKLELTLLILLAWHIYLNRQDVLKPFLWAGISAIVMLLALVIMYFADFEAVFFKLHELLFTNDLWLLNPKTDRLIQLMPLDFFKRFTQFWLGTVVGIHALFAGIYFAYHHSKRQRGIFIKKI